MHHFCDASEEGYGTVTYVVQHNSKGKVHIAFVMGKARVAPLKHTTIPCLELTAATMAVRMDRLLRKELELQLTNSVFWTDSTAVLKYINNETTRFRTFVANRVAEIRKVSTGSQWRHVGTHLNPAYYASRGQKVDVFVQNQAWISGPDFLTQSSDNWPENPDRLTDLSAADPKIKKSATINALAAGEMVDVMQKLIEYYSSWMRLKKAVAWILKVRNTLLSMVKKRKEQREAITLSETDKDQQERQLYKFMANYKASLSKTSITVDDLKEAEVEIIRHCQRKRFQEEITSLKKGEPVKRSSHIYKLNPILQDGILRVGGRLNRATKPEESKHPVILAKDL